MPDGSAQPVGTHAEEVVSRQSSRITPRKLQYHDCYRVTDLRQSECAHVAFVYDTATKKKFVLKALKAYQDETRYALQDRSARHACLREALRVNRTFSSPFSGIYKGLVRLVHPEGLEHLDIQRDLIITDAPIKYPAPEQLDEKAEYALLMTELPANKDLPSLLFAARSDTDLLEEYGRLLVDRVVYMHKHKRFELELDLCEPRMEWGSLPQLKKKLEGNLQFLGEALKRSKNLNRDYYAWYKEQEERLPKFLESAYDLYFANRVRDGCIRHCHGDLKAPNIWIAPHYSIESNEVRETVFLLDAIDFNPSFANIDILSDFAMLVVDLHVRMGDGWLAGLMIKRYLERTNQQDERIKAVLTYYLLEKAIVGAAVSVLDHEKIDHDMMSLSRAYLKVAEEYAEALLEYTEALQVHSRNVLMPVVAGVF